MITFGTPLTLSCSGTRLLCGDPLPLWFSEAVRGSSRAAPSRSTPKSTAAFVECGDSSPLWISLGVAKRPKAAPSRSTPKCAAAPMECGDWSPLWISQSATKRSGAAPGRSTPTPKCFWGMSSLDTRGCRAVLQAVGIAELTNVRLLPNVIVHSHLCTSLTGVVPSAMICMKSILSPWAGRRRMAVRGASA